MITDIKTVRFARTKENAENSITENGIMLYDNTIPNQILIDKDLKVVPFNQMYNYTEISLIGLHKLTIQ